MPSSRLRKSRVINMPPYAFMAWIGAAEMVSKKRKKVERVWEGGRRGKRERKKKERQTGVWVQGKKKWHSVV
jgi:hypothetical protein